MERSNNYILNYLDEPTKILFFTPGEIVAIGVSFFGGLWMNRFLMGIMLAALSVYVLRKLRQRFQQVTARQLIYWFLPHSEAPLQVKIPSYMREWIS